MFQHRQRVAHHRRLVGVTRDGQRGWFDDWSEVVEVRATKRDRRPFGYVVVKFKDGGCLSVHESALRAL